MFHFKRLKGNIGWQNPEWKRSVMGFEPSTARWEELVKKFRLGVQPTPHLINIMILDSAGGIRTCDPENCSPHNPI